MAATDALCQDPPQNDSAPPPDGPGWALFDTRVVLGDRDSANPAGAAVSKMSNGRDVRVSLHRFATPPASSCLELYTDDELYDTPSVVAADGDLLLLHMVLTVKNDPLAKLTHNFLVYKVDPDECPWMLSLPPPCDWYARSQDTTIARSAGEGFVVANLMVSRDIDDTTMSDVEMGTLWLYRSATDKWETKRLGMPHDPKQGLVPWIWFTDTVFSFRGYGCWVDYHLGILYCDVLSPDPELAFLRFPSIEIWRGDRWRPDMYRTVSACRGHVKFVNIDNGQFRSTESDDEQEYTDSEDDKECIGCPDRNKESPGSFDEFTMSDDYVSTITTWTLRMPEFEWVEDTTLEVEELWSLLSYQHLPLPRTVPTYPVISPQEADVLHFILKGPSFYDKAWMITIDMKKKSLRKHTLYENPIEMKDSDFDVTNTFFGLPRVIIQLFR